METAARQHSEESAAKATARVERESASHEQTRQDFPNALMRLQRTHGNRFVQRMVRAGVIQAKVKVSEPGDPYEQEADRVAERVMRMPARELEEEETFGPAKHEQVQRTCAPCEEERKIQRVCAGCEEEEKVQRLAAGPGAMVQRQAAPEDEISSLDELGAALTGKVMAKRRPGARDGAAYAPAAEPSLARAADGAGRAGAAPREDSLDDGALQSGGQPLPDHVRNFYEDRFGRDFGEVRVHTGADSARANEDVNAYAFTYGSHVWLGREQSVEPSFILAHELAHVVQQKQPPLMRKARKEKSSSRAHGGRGGGEGARRDGEVAQHQTVGGELLIQRIAPYWEPSNMDGTATHKELLPRFGAANTSIFTEAPVPNANKDGSGHDLKGCADLYGASTTVGVYFRGDQWPAKLTTKTCPKLMQGGAKFSHITNAAPTADDFQNVLRVDTAPKSIKLGDLKPSYLTHEALLGVNQLKYYSEGFRIAQKEVDAMRSVSPAGAKWGPIVVTTFGPSQITIPSDYIPPGSSQTPRQVVLKENSRVIDPKHPSRPARLFVVPDPVRAGIWNYMWFPDTPVTVASLPAKVRDLDPEIERRVINPLINSPIQKAKKAKPSAPAPAQAQRAPRAVARLVVTHEPGPVLRRKGPAKAPPKDDFDFTQWKKAHDEITKQFGEESKTREFKDAAYSLKAAEAQEHEKKMGLSLPDVSQATKEKAKELDKIEFWTGASAMPFGHLRRIFGRAFVTVAQLYIKIRDKFRELLKAKKRTGGKSGILGAALKAAFSVIKLAGSYVINKVTDRLHESLEQGVTEKVKSIFSFDIVGDVQTKVEEVKKLREEFEQKAVDTADALLKKTVGPYETLLKQIEEVQRVVSDIVQIVNLVRWGVRAIACASPPAWGCLWILAQSVLEELAARVVDTCWFKKKITPLISKVKWVAELPKELADLIIEKIRGFLPGPVHDVFAKLDKSKVDVNPNDIECEKEDSEDAMTPERQALLDMQEALGEEKFQAFTELVQKAGIPRDKPLTAAEIRKLTETVRSSGVTADQLKEYADNYPKAPPGMPTDVATFLENVKVGKDTGTTPSAPTTTPTAPTTTPPGDKSGGDPSSSGGGGGIEVVEAKDRPFDLKETEKIPGTVVYVVNQSWSHTAGTTPEIDLIGFNKGKAVVMVKNVKTKVTKRYWFPKGTDEKTATYLIVVYQLQQGVDFSPIPGGLMKDEKVKAGLEVKKK
jgi:hypothetical protein